MEGFYFGLLIEVTSCTLYAIDTVRTSDGIDIGKRWLTKSILSKRRNLYITILEQCKNISPKENKNVSQ